MIAILARRVRLPNVILFREYVRRAPTSRLLPAKASSSSPSPSPNTAFTIKDEPKELVEPTVDPVADLMTSIKSATNPLQLLDSVGLSESDVNKMTSDQFMRTLQTLLGLHRATKDSVSAAQIVGHPSFLFLCKRLRRLAPSMDVSSNLNALKIISHLKIPANSELSLVLLSLLSYQINDLTLQEMIFADFLLNTLKPRTQKAEAIKAALPVLFEIQLPIQYDPENNIECIELLRFATSKTVSPETVEIIATQLEKQLREMKDEQWKEILRILCFAPNLPPTAWKLVGSTVLRNATIIQNVDTNELLDTAGLIARKCPSSHGISTPSVKHYMNKCVDAFIERDVDLEESVYLQKKFKLISFTSWNLLRHIDNKINANLDSWPTAKLDTVFTIVQAFAMAAYRPMNWEGAILPAILENVTNKIHDTKHPTWLKFTLQLILMDHFEKALVERVLHKEYLADYMQRNNFAKTDVLTTVILYHEACRHGECNIDHDYLQSIVRTYLQNQSDNPFRNALTDKLGAQKCLFNVRTKYGHCIQNLVKYNVAMRQFASFNAVQRDSTGFAQLEHITCERNERLIAIDPTPHHFYWMNRGSLKNVYILRRQQLQHNGLIVFEFTQKYWTNVPEMFDVRTELLWKRIDELLTQAFQPKY